MNLRTFPIHRYLFWAALLATAFAFELSALPQDPAANTAAAEIQARLQAVSAAQQGGDPEVIATANKKLIAFGLKEMADLRSMQEAYPYAIALYQRALQLEPNAATEYSLAFAYFRAGHPDEGLKLCDALLKTDLKNAVYWNLQGKLQLMNKDYKNAIDSLQKSLELQSDPEVEYTVGSTFLHLKEKDKATAIFQQMEKSAANKAPLYVMEGRAYEVTGFPAEAEAKYKEAIATDAKTSRGHYFLGLFYFSSNGWESTPRAREEFLAEVKENPTDFFGNYFMGYITSREKNYADSDKYLKVAAAARPDWPEPYLYLGLNAYGRGDNAAAERMLRKTIELTGKDEERNGYQIRRAYFTLGRILISQGNKAEGAKLAERSKAIETKLLVSGRQEHALAANEAAGGVGASTETTKPISALHMVDNPATPLDAKTIASLQMPEEEKGKLAGAEKELRGILGNAYNDLGTAEARQKQFGPALADFQQAERWNPETPNLMRNIGRAAFLQQNYAESARALKVYIKQNPDDQRAEGMLALALFSIKDYPEAVTHFDAMGDAPMGDAFMAYAWATSLARSNHKQRASEILEKLTANPIPPPILVEAGKLYTEIGDRAKAQSCYEKAKEEDPSVNLPN